MAPRKITPDFSIFSDQALLAFATDGSNPVAHRLKATEVLGTRIPRLKGRDNPAWMNILPKEDFERILDFCFNQFGAVSHHVFGSTRIGTAMGGGQTLKALVREWAIARKMMQVGEITPPKNGKRGGGRAAKYIWTKDGTSAPALALCEWLRSTVYPALMTAEIKVLQKVTRD